MWREYIHNKRTEDARYDYFRSGVCGLCKPEVRMGNYCDSDGKCRIDEQIITILPDTERGTLHVILRPAFPDKDHSKDLDEISILLFEERGEKKGHITKSLQGCDYDPSLELSISWDEAKRLVENLPLFKENGMPPEEISGLIPNIFGGQKKDWAEQYQKYFESIKMAAGQRGILKEPVF